jgi:hypothetical protein
MIRPEITEETFNKVKILSGKTNCSFEEALKLVLNDYELWRSGRYIRTKQTGPNFKATTGFSKIVGLNKKC